VSASPVLFGITKWLTWAVRSIRTEAGQAREAAVSLLAVVSPQRLRDLVPLLDATAEGGADLEVHHLLRFNLLNLGGDPATVCAIALRGKGEVLRCELVPSVVVRAGARYPFALEVRTGLVSEAVDIQVESGTGERAWVFSILSPEPIGPLATSRPAGRGVGLPVVVEFGREPTRGVPILAVRPSARAGNPSASRARRAPKPRVITLTEGERECFISIERRCAIIGLLDAAEDRAA
jgi:hypothetical protein